ncbi:MAG: hypothetical protein HY721_08145 [Planctomycetes bacterium]|nr:hypothetical protein [Planctomycetota bacterium]
MRIGYQRASVSILVCNMLLAARGLCGDPVGDYTFELLAELGQQLLDDPKVRFAFDLEPWSLNNRGEVAFGAELCRLEAEGQECQIFGEGAFKRYPDGTRKVLAQAGRPAPGQGTFGSFFYGTVALNEPGDVCFCFAMEGGDAELFFFSESLGEVSAVGLSGRMSPCGLAFGGCTTHPVVNNEGTVIFAAIVKDAPVSPTGDGSGWGVFTWSPATGEISKVVCPGDAAPGGKVFDFAVNPWINDRGDIAFGAHVSPDPCLFVSGLIPCAESIYFKPAGRDEIVPVALQGQEAPGGGTYHLAFGPTLNNRGEVVFFGDLTPGDPTAFGKALGVFLYSGGKVIPIARPLDEMPGGGKVVTTSFFVGGSDVNDCGDVAFNATLDSRSLDIDGDGEKEPDQGLFLWSKGAIRPVVRTGKELPGIGTVLALLPPDYLSQLPDGIGHPWIGTALNERGQIILTAALEGGRGVMVLATPATEKLCAPPATTFVRGDPNVDAKVNIADAVFVLNALFLGGPQPGCADAADSNDDSLLNIADPVYLLNSLFLGGLPPPAPFPGCGEDPTGGDALECTAFGPCAG